MLKQVQESLATGGDNVVSRRWWDDGLDEDLNVKAEEMDQKMHGFVIRDGQLPDGNDSNTGMTGSESSISAVLETFRGRGPGFSVDEVGNEHYHVRKVSSHLVKSMLTLRRLQYKRVLAASIFLSSGQRPR